MRFLLPVAHCALVGSLLLAGPTSARAAGGGAASARLVYMRGPGAEACPAEYAVRAAVSARLGYDPFFSSAPDTLFAEIRHSRGAFRTVVKLVDDRKVQRGAREFSVQGDDCSAIVDAMGLTISLTIDPSSAIGAPPPEQSSELQPAPSPPPPERVHPTATSDASGQGGNMASRPAPSAAITQRWSLYAGVGATASLRGAPSGTAGPAVLLGARWRMLSLDLEGRAYYPVVGASDMGSAQVRSWLLAGSIVPCIHYRRVFGCPVVSGGVIGATARNVSRSIDQTGPWSAAGGRLGGQWSISSHVDVRAYAELLAIMTRDTFWIDGTLVYTVGQWSGSLAVAGLWRFW